MISDNKKAIAVYLDDNDKIETELSWLWKTWQLYSLETEFDLVVYYNPAAKNRLDNFPGIVRVEMPYVRMAGQYKFLNSHYFCLDAWSEPLKKYQYILKTDCDVFLTENIKGYTPSGFLVGQGGYYLQSDSKKIDYIKYLSSQLGLEYKSMSLVGASFFGKTDQVLPVVKNQALITELILEKYCHTKEFADAGFDRGISSMIAGEIFINHAFANQHITLYALDSKCWLDSKIGKNILHIHAWHSSAEWSKHAFFRGEYSSWKVDLADAFKNAANYCQWVATLSIEDLQKFKREYSEKRLPIDYALFDSEFKNVVFKNDGGVLLKLPKHKYSQIFSKRDNHEVLFRRINSWLIDQGYIKNNIIDLGAWIGDNAIPWSKKLDGTVYAIDPSSGNCDFISQVCKINDVKNVKIIQKAISEKNKTISTKLEFGDDLHHCTFTESDAGKTAIQSYSLDFLDETNEIANVGYMHLDVEGMEFSVVKGATEIIKKYSPVITFEQHTESDDYLGLSSHLINLGYQVYMIDETLPGCNPDCRNFLAMKLDMESIVANLELHLGIKDLFKRISTD